MQQLKAGTPGTNSLFDNTYTYDSAGNIKTIVDAKNSNQKQCFTYDTLHRLTQATTYPDDDPACTTSAGNGQYSQVYGGVYPEQSEGTAAPVT